MRACTTVMTILSRLVDNGLVESEARGRGHVYRAAGDPDEVTAQSISSLLAASADPRAALAHFVESLDDPKLVAELAETPRTEVATTGEFAESAGDQNALVFVGPRGGVLRRKFGERVLRPAATRAGLRDSPSTGFTMPPCRHSCCRTPWMVV